MRHSPVHDESDPPPQLAGLVALHGPDRAEDGQNVAGLDIRDRQVANAGKHEALEGPSPGCPRTSGGPVATPTLHDDGGSLREGGHCTAPPPLDGVVPAVDGTLVLERGKARLLQGDGRIAAEAGRAAATANGQALLPALGSRRIDLKEEPVQLVVLPRRSDATHELGGQRSSGFSHVRSPYPCGELGNELVRVTNFRFNASQGN